jgi:hypothetical protein
MIERLSPVSNGVSRVLLFSMRNLTHHVSRCPPYEFEDVIAAADRVDLVAPRPPAEPNNRAIRYMQRILRQHKPLIDGEIRVTRDYDLFVAMCRTPRDLRYVRLIKGLHERCQKSVCVFDELWPDDIAKTLSDLKAVRDFDSIFVNLECSVEATEQLAHKPTQFIPYAVDALKFCPYPKNPRRSIDVFCMGRRPPGLHQALFVQAERDEIFYVYDTASNFSVINPREHRRLLANMIKRSRYFITYPGQFDRNPGHFVLGTRYFEGAAGGAILLGMGPANTVYERYLDWPDAVFSTPEDGSQILELIAELDEQPQRLARIRRDSVVNALLRHDWVYRWRQILDGVGLAVSKGILEREECLKRLATCTS